MFDLHDRGWRGLFQGAAGVGVLGGCACFPGGDPCLQAVTLCRDLVACLQVEQGEIGVHELFVRAEFLGKMPFLDGALVVPQTAKGHPQGKARVEIGRGLGKDVPEELHGATEIAPTKGEHGVIVAVLEGWHIAFDI